MSGMLRWSSALAPWAVCGVLAALILQGLLAQVELQNGLDSALHGVLVNIRSARALTRQTADALQPMTTTADTIALMNQRLRAMHQDLAAMNGTLALLLQRQGTMVTGIDQLNDYTRGVQGDLLTVTEQNAALLKTNGSLTEQTMGQAEALDQLQKLTEDASADLRTLNGRFRLIR